MFEFLSISLIKNTFFDKGTKSTKKQLLTSKEKEVWSCECGTKNNDIDNFCNSCHKDIYGFKSTEVTPLFVEKIFNPKSRINF